MFRKNQHLYVEKQAHQGLIWLRSGVALTYRLGSDGNYDLALPIYRGVWTAPSLFSGTHALSQRAQTDCTADIIEPAAAAQLLLEPEFVELVAGWCVEDYQLMLDGTANVNRTRAEEKLLGWVRFAIKCSRSDPRADERTLTGTLDWPFNISQMAEFMRLSRPHLSNVLTRLAEQKRLEIKKRQVTVY